MKHTGYNMNLDIHELELLRETLAERISLFEIIIRGNTQRGNHDKAYSYTVKKNDLEKLLQRIEKEGLL